MYVDRLVIYLMLSLVGVYLYYMARKLSLQTQKISDLEVKLARSEAQFMASKIEIQVGHSTNVSVGFFSKSFEVTYFSQLTRGGIPIAAREVIKRDKVKIYNEENIKLTMKELALPLAQSGFTVRLLK